MDTLPDVATIETSERSTQSERQKVVMVILFAALNTLISVIYSMISPFYPPLAVSIGVPHAWIGVPFAVYQVTMICVCAYLGSSPDVLGPVRVLKVGILILSSSVIAFALSPLISAPSVFLLFTGLLRALQGVGAGMMMTGMITLVTQEFRDGIGKVFGCLEGVSGTAGFLIGPVVGGIMHDTVGFWLPFVLFGSVLMLSELLCCFLFRNYRDVVPSCAEGEANEGDALLRSGADMDTGALTPEMHVYALLKTPVVWVVGLSVVVSSSSLGLIDVGLATYANQLSEATNGTMFSDLGKNALFFLSPVSYGLIILPLGILTDKYKPFRLFFSLGLLLSLIGCLFLGPAPLVLRVIPSLASPFKALVSCSLSLCTLGIGFAFCFAPFTSVLMQIASKKGWPNCTACYSVVSSCYGIFFCIGMSVGPAVAAPMCDAFGFAYSGGLFGAAQLVMLLLFILFSSIYEDWLCIDPPPEIVRVYGTI